MTFSSSKEEDMQSVLSLSKNSLNKLLVFISEKMRNRHYDDLSKNLREMSNDDENFNSAFKFIFNFGLLLYKLNDFDKALSYFKNINADDKVKVSSLVEELKKY